MPTTAPTTRTLASALGSEPADLLLAALRRYEDAARELWKCAQARLCLSDTDLTAVSLLIESARLGTDFSPKDLSKRLGISSASTTVLVDRLEARDWLRRTPHPRDRRGVLLAPSDSARERFAEMSEPVQRALADAVATRPARELAAAERVLSALAERSEAALTQLAETPASS